MAMIGVFGADFSGFNKEVKKAEAGLTDFEKAANSVVRNIESDLLAMFSVSRAAAFISDTVAAAGALKVLSQQTQISTDDLQVMAGAMSEFGVTQDEVGRGLNTLSKKIAGGSDSVAAALAQMGLSLEDVRNLRGQELFLKIENGLATLKGSLRDTAAAALFGDKLGAAMAGASEGIDGAMDRQRKLNTLMSKESIDALDQYSTAINRAKTNIGNLTANALGPLAEGFNTIIAAIENGAPKWKVFWSLFASSGGMLTDMIDKQNQAADAARATAAAQAAASAKVVAAKTEEQKHEEFLQILRKNAAGELTAANIAHLEELRKMGQLNAENAAGVGVTAAQLKLYEQGLQDAKKAASDLAAAQKEADALALTSYRAQIDNLKTMQEQRAKSYGTAEQIAQLRQLDAAELALTQTVYAQLNSEKDRLALVEQSNKRRQDIANQIMEKESAITDRIAQALLLEAQAHQKRQAALGLDAQGYVKVENAAETLRVKLDQLHAQAVAGVSQKEQEALLLDEFAQANLDAAVATDKARDAYNKANAALGQTPGVVGAAKKSLKEMADEAWATAKSFEEMARALRLTVAARDEATKGAGAGASLGTVTDAGGVARDLFGRPVVGTPGVAPTMGITVNVDGSVITNGFELSRVVGDAITSSFRNGGRRLPV